MTQKTPIDSPPEYLDEAPPEYPADYFRETNTQEEASDPMGEVDLTQEPPAASELDTHEADQLFSSTLQPAESFTAPSLVSPAAANKLTEGLNDEQLQAVTAHDGHVLVLAGAGSGKTRVLTYRLAWLLAQGRANNAQIFAVTFTNKAAKEMLLRLQGLSIRQTYAMWVGTFHGLCHRFLRQHYDAAGLINSFQIMDTDEQISVVRQVMEALKISSEEFPPRELLGWINARKESGERAAQVAKNSKFGRDSGIQLEVYQAYEVYCQKENRVDFAELLLRTLEVLERNESIRAQYQNRFRYLLVDEFQDTNTMQYRLLQLLCGENSSIFAVGDDDQSIYGFRGARLENLRDFETRYAKGHVIRLEQSYRSTSTILNAANEVIANNVGRLGKTLWTAQEGGEKIRIFPAYNDEEEAAWMMDEIRKLSETDGVPWSDIAILYRINAHSRGFEQAAIRSGIPYRIYGGFRFYDRAEIRHALAYLRLVANAHDEMSFMRVVNFPPRGIGEKSIEQLRERAQAHHCSMMDAIPYMEGRSAPALMSFAQLIAGLRHAIKDKDLAEAIGHVVAESGLQAFYGKQKEGKERLENLDELQNAAIQYAQEWQRRVEEGALAEDTAEVVKEAETPVAVAQRGANSLLEYMEEETHTGELGTGERALIHFLTDAVLDSAEPDSSQKSAINMMSVHSAKGLEFLAVFIGGLEHGTFPHENNLDVEEERRLMYVALTRAKRHLHLSYTHQRLMHGRIQQKIPSSFLTEIPQELIAFVRPPSVAASIESARQERFGQSRGGGYSGGRDYAQNKGRQKDTLKPSRGDSPVRNFEKTLANAGVHKGLPEVSEASSFPFELGQRVRHKKFGDGIVINYEGAGADQRILVSFGGLGQKWLVLSLAKLVAE